MYTEVLLVFPIRVHREFSTLVFGVVHRKKKQIKQNYSSKKGYVLVRKEKIKHKQKIKALSVEL
jgi:hypothetical protein